jgi:hypothetical protein
MRDYDAVSITHDTRDIDKREIDVISVSLSFILSLKAGVTVTFVTMQC